MPPALESYLNCLYESWITTGETSDKALAKILSINPESVRQRRVRLYDLLITQGPNTVPNLLRIYIQNQDAQIMP
jgi:hypothetical protein